MRKMLCIVAMLVVALVVSANLPRAGPDMVSDLDNAISQVENTTYLNAAHDIGAISVAFSVEELFTAEETFAVVSSPRESRSPVVTRNQDSVSLRGYNDMMTLLDFRLSHQTDTGRRPMRT
jgi:hypothetical protein